ncbi:hypothetical protein PHMEG_00039963 [Phytophthora megakarya]|uniref:Uncharacterized protein n=1 Tax=Phytophthora megakarya TaxID=4795 RepID=A0A225UEU7_9STRA|nr:hypothetical protein PHMEG_00039963 [Phytophthora megakarya]
MPGFGVDSDGDVEMTTPQPMTNENKTNVLVSVKASVETRVLEHLARFILRKALVAVTDADILVEIER